MKKLTVTEYFRMPETVRRMELLHGVVREPPAPKYGHQALITELTVLLKRHVDARRLGKVCVPPNRETFVGDSPISSNVLPEWDLTAEQIFI